VLEASFICLRLPSWRRNVRKQAIKAPKIHFIDTGLACHLLGIRRSDQLRHHPLRGAIFESWVVAEVYKSRIHRGLPPDLFHFREAKGLEVDLLLEQGDRVVAVEAKSAATVASDFFTALQRLGKDVAARLPHVTYEPRLVYGGDNGQQRTVASVIPWAEIHDARW
jgi:predicted AAA+ superfamily ATPase